MAEKSLDKKILELIKLSSVSQTMKDAVTKKLPHLLGVAKAKVLTILVKEQKKLQSLGKKKERIIEKYTQLMERVSKKSKGVKAK